MLFSNLEILLSLKPGFSFKLPYFGALLFENHDELDKTPLSKFVVLMQLYTLDY